MMSYKIVVRSPFKREAKLLQKRYRSFKEDFLRLIEELEENPNFGTDLGGGIRKIRMRIASKGKGKSGGARVITFTAIVAIEEFEINLLYIYDKSECDNITKKEIEALLKEIGLI